MQPNLQSYQDAANAIYSPQKDAEQAQLAATRDTTKNSLEAQKGGVETTYQDAIDTLTNSVQDETGQLNLLYSQRLGGQFSGLQGNDLGGLYSRANQQKSVIASTRANKLNEISAGETNADIEYNTAAGGLGSKYASLEAQYANDNYGSAVKDYNSNQAKIAASNASAANKATTAANTLASKYGVTGKKVDGVASNANGYSFTGPNGQPISLAEYVNGKGGDVNDILDLLQNGDSYDKNIYKSVSSLNDPTQILKKIQSLDKGNYYGLK